MMSGKIKKFIKRYILSDWPIKLTCILAALVLWVYVASGQSTIGKFPSKIPVKTENVQSGLIPIYDDKEIEIQISAEPAVWNKLSADSFRATLDLSGLTAGTYQLPVSVISTVEGVTIVKKTPEKIMVSLEPVTKKTVSVNRIIRGSAASGMVVGSVNFSADQAEVSGPKSVVEGITEAITVIELNGEASNFQKTIKLVALDAAGEEIPDIIFNPMEVSVNVAIIKAGNSKTVGIRPSLSGNAADGFYVSRISVNPDTVSVNGSDAALDGLNYIETNPIDITGISGTTEKTASLIIPDGVAIDQGQPNRVRVSINVSENIIMRQMPVTINPINIADNLRFSFSPQSVTAQVSGPQSQINNLAAGDISYTIDLSGKSAGTYSYDLSAFGMKTPDGVVVNSVVPSSISVVLESK